MLQTAIKLSVPKRCRARRTTKAAVKTAKARGVWLDRHGAAAMSGNHRSKRSLVLGGPTRILSPAKMLLCVRTVISSVVSMSQARQRAFPANLKFPPRLLQHTGAYDARRLSGKAAHSAA